jgi:GTP cyclohydrolase I
MNSPFEEPDDEREFSEPFIPESDDSESAESDLPQFDDDGNMPVMPTEANVHSDPLILTDEEFREFVDLRHTIAERADFNGSAQGIRDFLDAIGEDTTREGLKDTTRRVIESWEELYCGYAVDIPSLFTTFDAEQYDEMVLLRGIHFYSMCEHHILPFYGVAHVAYIPGTKIVGLSKLARLVEAFSRRLQNQERLTKQIVDTLNEHLSPRGAACIIEGQHMCMACRGVQKPNSVMVTSCITGAFNTPATRAELFSLIKG